MARGARFKGCGRVGLPASRIVLVQRIIASGKNVRGLRNLPLGYSHTPDARLLNVRCCPLPIQPFA